MTAAVAAETKAAAVVDLTRAVLAAKDLDSLSAGADLKAENPVIRVQLGFHVWKLSTAEALDALEAALALAIEEPLARAHLAPFFRLMTEAYLCAQDLAAAHVVRGAH